MSSTSSRTSANDSTSASTYRVNYSEYVADITNSPKTSRKLATTGIGHHINPLHNQYPNRPNQPTQPQQLHTGGMPQYGGAAEKCARCLKAVYLAEKKVGAGRSYHSSCFNCYTCKRKLDATTLSEHKGEIYCKACYTKQFGAHGLISGVTMSTEHTTTRQTYTSRRSSVGNDLDTTPSSTFQQTRQRANSSENLFRDDYNPTKNDQFSQKYPRPVDVSYEQTSTSNKKNNGVDILVDTKYQRPSSPTGFAKPVDTKYQPPTSPIGFEKIVDTKYQRPSSPIGFGRPVDTTINNNQQRPSQTEDDRRKYSYDGDRISYGSGASAMVDIPIVVQTKRSDTTIDRMELPVNPIRDNERSRSPSITSNDSYQRQSNLSDDYSRLHINEDKNNQKYSNDNSMNTIPSKNPLSTQNYYHSSSTSSYESKYRGSTSNTNNYEREQFRSRESSPSAVAPNRYQSSSPTTGYSSSSTTIRTYPVETTPYKPQHEYFNTQISTDLDERRPSSTSSQNTSRVSTGLTDFVAKTNIAGHSTGNNFSALGALITKPRHQSDDDFDN
ncbi:unnamed protein product [Adineta steineri]|uniref:LIM zinc-binding domain-containing protein n=1 Tax=Adineta steineri TaxID=433720 RepID=A0A813RRZ9_9BILA|nr:unnamed protein product [Adineta steineri]CAF0786643.1 unnamed protein product [Adineta steineri]CAF3532046.1 unnamed protein product [Adineta steineri]CAF3699546.1 unnamed protein product [Adineta steineri]